MDCHSWDLSHPSVFGEVLSTLYSVYSRLGELFKLFWFQTRSLNLTQTLTACQFLGPLDIILPQDESFEVGHFKAT